MEHNLQSSAAANPLKQYFRQVKLWMQLPSGTAYYNPSVVDFSDKGEVGVMPMTAKDELSLKNPDGLLNGESLVEVLSSCVPAIKNPRQLLTNDIDALITAIRFATFNDSLETIMSCPKCDHENTFKLDLEYALDNMSYLEPEYVINLDTGISIYVRPYIFPDLLKGLHAQFESTKLQRAMESESISDEERTRLFGKSFKELSSITFDLMQNSVIKIVDESNGVNVTNKAHIREFLFNVEKSSADKITNLVQEINLIGIKRTFTAKCEKCEHTWESEIDFNPVNFS